MSKIIISIGNHTLEVNFSLWLNGYAKIKLDGKEIYSKRVLSAAEIVEIEDKKYMVRFSVLLGNVTIEEIKPCT
jgi:hypothetical protein